MFDFFTGGHAHIYIYIYRTSVETTIPYEYSYLLDLYVAVTTVFAVFIITILCIEEKNKDLYEKL